jgi:hypothetical protein
VPTPPTLPEAAKRTRKPRGIKAQAKPGILKRGQALGLDGEVLSRSRSEGFRNEFDVPSTLIPEGFVAQWVRETCHGKPDEANVTAHMENGWRPTVTEGILKHYRMPAGTKHVKRDGLVLMLRPKALNDEALAEERQSAVELKQAQAEQFGVRKLPKGFDDGYVDETGKFDARRKLRRTVEGSPRDLMPERELAIGDDE